MTGNHSYLRAIAIDCHAPERLAVFWSRLLGSAIASYQAGTSGSHRATDRFWAFNESRNPRRARTTRTWT
ncbi:MULTISPECIES: VOC family protein [unclassified Streptomyces]|uniref:VOC family protein n=1 Tax=unclassified Streptomyces TaxID=2593676 RepID=UPI00386D3562